MYIIIAITSQKNWKDFMIMMAILILFIIIFFLIILICSNSVAKSSDEKLRQLTKEYFSKQNKE